MGDNVIIEFNGSGSGDWYRIYDGDSIIFEGHSLGPADLKDLLVMLGHNVKADFSLKDEDML